MMLPRVIYTIPASTVLSLKTRQLTRKNFQSLSLNDLELQQSDPTDNRGYVLNREHSKNFSLKKNTIKTTTKKYIYKLKNSKKKTSSNSFNPALSLKSCQEN